MFTFKDPTLANKANRLKSVNPLISCNNKTGVLMPQELYPSCLLATLGLRELIFAIKPSSPGWDTLTP